MTRSQETLLTNKLAGCNGEDIDPLHVRGNAANLEYRTIRFPLLTEAKISFVLSSRLAAFPQMCKGSIARVILETLFQDYQSRIEKSHRAVKFCKSTFLAYEVH